MNVAEILRSLVNKVDGKDMDAAPENPSQHSDQHAELYPVEVDNVDHTDSETMQSPMQDSIDLLRYLAGVGNGEAPCDTCGQAPCGCEPESPEISGTITNSTI